MGIQDKIKNQIAGVRRGRPAVRKNKTFQNVVHTQWDRSVWDTIRENPAISEQVVNLYSGDADPDLEPYELGPELLQDLAYLLFKTGPRFENKINVHKSARGLNRFILDILKQLPAYQDLHDWTMCDQITTTMASETLYPTVVDLLKQIEDAMQNGPGEGDGAGQQGQGGSGSSPIQEANEQAAKDKADGDGEDAEAGADVEPPDDLLDENERDLDEIALDDMEEVDADQFEDFNLDDVETQLNAAMADVAEELESLENTRKGVGIDDGAWSSATPEERLRLARQLNTPQMRELANIIGRMKKFAQGIKATRVIDADDQIVAIEMGNDLRKVIRSEFAQLATKETAYNFYRRYYDRELFQFRYQGEAEAGRGPVVVAIDKSGSMGGNPMNWALAVAEALRQFAAQDGRDFHAIFFSHTVDARFTFDKGKTDIDTLLNFLGTSVSGGTAFDEPLNEALEYARQAHMDNDQVRADVVFITDGYAYLDEDWIKRYNEKREDIKCHVYSVFVGGAGDVGRYDNGATGPVQLLDMLSDAVISVHELTESSAKDIFAKVG